MDSGVVSDFSKSNINSSDHVTRRKQTSQHYQPYGRPHGHYQSYAQPQGHYQPYAQHQGSADPNVSYPLSVPNTSAVADPYQNSNNHLAYMPCGSSYNSVPVYGQYNSDEAPQDHQSRNYLAYLSSRSCNSDGSMPEPVYVPPNSAAAYEDLKPQNYLDYLASRSCNSDGSMPEPVYVPPNSAAAYENYQSQNHIAHYSTGSSYNTTGSSYNTGSLPSTNYTLDCRNSIANSLQPTSDFIQHQTNQGPAELIQHQDLTNTSQQQQSTASLVQNELQNTSEHSLPPANSTLNTPVQQSAHHPLPQSQRQNTSAHADSSKQQRISAGNPSAHSPLVSRMAMLDSYLKKHVHSSIAAEAKKTYYKRYIQLECLRFEKMTQNPAMADYYKQYYDDAHVQLVQEIKDMIQQPTSLHATPPDVQASTQHLHALSGFSPIPDDAQERESLANTNQQSDGPGDTQQPVVAPPCISPSLPQENSTANNQPLKSKAVAIMQQWYDQNATDPYPKKGEIETMAQQARITEAQVKKWFTNRRHRNGFVKKNPQKRIRGKKRDFNQIEVLAQQEMHRTHAKKQRSSR